MPISCRLNPFVNCEMTSRDFFTISSITRFLVRVDIQIVPGLLTYTKKLKWWKINSVFLVACLDVLHPSLPCPTTLQSMESITLSQPYPNSIKFAFLLVSCLTTRYANEWLAYLLPMLLTLLLYATDLRVQLLSSSTIPTTVTVTATTRPSLLQLPCVFYLPLKHSLRFTDSVNGRNGSSVT